MKQSLTYYLTLFVIKLKGLKKEFSRDPIDYKKIRKEDVQYPKGAFFRQNQIRNFKVSNTVITEVAQKDSHHKLLIFIHGGAFISGPAKHHWNSIQTIFKQTHHTIWMCDYPKAPEHKILEISQNIDAVYQKALESYKPEQITLIGDSVGGTLITALTQRLVKKNGAIPHHLILVSPVMDATMSNPEIDAIDLIDPMLSKAGILSAKKMCTENVDLKDPIISPLNGCFDSFPKVSLFIATKDIMYPDQQLMVQKLKKTQINFEVIVGESMPHIWPFLPVMKEAKVALKHIITVLNR